jgi:hypothetical protein
MIAVLGARHLDTIDENALRELATVAGGGTGVSPVVRTQAAWLWLRHAKRTSEAIEALTSTTASSGKSSETTVQTDPAQPTKPTSNSNSGSSAGEAQP